MIGFLIPLYFLIPPSFTLLLSVSLVLPPLQYSFLFPYSSLFVPLFLS